MLLCERDSFGICLVAEILTYIKVCCGFSPCEQLQNSLTIRNYLSGRWWALRVDSFSVCLATEILTYVKYAAVSAPASSFKIAQQSEIICR